jgi:GT2 family glycosyltransferase
MISVSIVSHGHIEHVRQLIGDFRRLRRSDVELLLTLNTENDRALSDLQGTGVRLFPNESPRGFGANHNAAFRVARGEFFCVLNPDVRLGVDPFGPLLVALDSGRVGVAGPRVVDSAGAPQPSYRSVPTPGELFAKALGKARAISTAPASLASPDWIAGMFMFFRREAFAAVEGFDERYFLYYEDVDICCRLWLAGYEVCVAGEAVVIHDGQYASRRNLKHMRWHLQSIWRFFRSAGYRRFVALRRRPQVRL